MNKSISFFDIGLNHFNYLATFKKSCSKNKNMNRIKEVLDKKGLKQTWLAEQLGKSYNMVNGYVKNRRQPKLEILFEIAKLLEVEVKDLINEDVK